MMIQTLVVASVAIFPSLALAKPLVSRQIPMQISCDTSANSPYSTDVVAALDILKGKGDVQCVQNQSGGAMCTEFQSYGSAKLGICGDNGLSITCRDATYYLQQIIDDCVQQGKVGGTYQVGGGGGHNRVQIWHT